MIEAITLLYRTSDGGWGVSGWGLLTVGLILWLIFS